MTCAARGNRCDTSFELGASSTGARTQRRHVHALALATCAAGLVLACSTPARCEEISDVELADGEATHEGMTADDVMVMTNTPHVSPFAWTAELSNAVADDSTTVMISVSRLTSPAHHLVTEQVGDTKQDENCGASLVVPIRLRLETSDGGLDDSFDGDLVADLRGGIPSSVSFFVDLDYDELIGSVRPIESGAGELSVRFGASEVGDLGLSTVRRDGGNVEEQFRSLGGWAARE
jgi:hypothetical protein